MKRTVFFVSDGTGITAETVGHALLTQFGSLDFERVSIPFANTSSKIEDIVNKINHVHSESDIRPIVFATMTNPEFAKQLLENTEALVLDLFDTYIKPLESELGLQSSYVTGRSHGLVNQSSYDIRMEAINFTLNHDDGASLQHLSQAEVIIVGVSRSGKTPTCVYLSMQYGILAANYPLTEDDLESDCLPRFLRQFKKRIYGLTIAPDRLQQIRQQRRPDSNYSSFNQCRKEIKSAEEIYQIEGLPCLNTTEHSIEEIASRIMHDMRLLRQR